MHYEVEQAGTGGEHHPDIGTHAEPERWHVVNVFDTDVVPTPLTFDTIDQALDYVRQTSGRLRIVEVTDEGERVPVNKYWCWSALERARAWNEYGGSTVLGTASLTDCSGRPQGRAHLFARHGRSEAVAAE